MKVARIAALLALLAGAAATGRAQVIDTTRMTPLVVTATRLPAASNTLANSVTVLEGDDLARAGIGTVADAARVFAGAAVVQGGSFGSVTSLFLRGGQSTYARVLVDGVPINAPGGALNLANLSTLNVERIELVRGPASVLYGSDAVSGVMQVFTRRGAGARAVFALSGGTYGSSDLSAELAAGGRSAGATLGVSQQTANGLYDYNNRYRNTTVSSSMRFAPDARSEITVAARYGNALFHYPTDGSGFQNDSNAYARARTLTASVEAGRFLTPRLEARVLAGYSESRDSTVDAQDNAADTNGIYAYHSTGVQARTSADLRFNIHAGTASIVTVGGAIEAERARGTNSYQSSFGPGGGSTAGDRTNRAAYAQIVTGWRDRAWLQAGARVDDNTLFGRFVTWRVGLAARIASATRVRMNVGTAFKEPTFDESVSGGFTVGNPALKPERSRSWEVGLEQGFSGRRGSVSLAYFAETFRDMIQYTFAPPPPDSANYFNIAGANASGVEVEGRYAPSRALRLRAQFTWLRTSVADSGFDGAQFAPGRPLIRRPAYSGALTADVVPVGRLSGGVRVIYAGRREDLDFSQYPAARVALTAYTRLDLWGEALLVRSPGRGSSVSLTARLDNAGGARYTEVFGFRTPGRLLKAGVRIEAGR